MERCQSTSRETFRFLQPDESAFAQSHSLSEKSAFPALYTSSAFRPFHQKAIPPCLWRTRQKHPPDNFLFFPICRSTAVLRQQNVFLFSGNHSRLRSKSPLLPPMFQQAESDITPEGLRPKSQLGQKTAAGLSLLFHPEAPMQLVRSFYGLNHSATLFQTSQSIFLMTNWQSSFCTSPDISPIHLL